MIKLNMKPSPNLGEGKKGNIFLILVISNCIIIHNIKGGGFMRVVMI